MAFAMNAEQAINALNEALRIIASLQASGSVARIPDKVEGREVAETVITSGDMKFEVIGALRGKSRGPLDYTTDNVLGGQHGARRWGHKRILPCSTLLDARGGAGA